jgi:histone H3/H4
VKTKSGSGTSGSSGKTIAGLHKSLVGKGIGKKAKQTSYGLGKGKTIAQSKPTSHGLGKSMGKGQSAKSLPKRWNLTEKSLEVDHRNFKAAEVRKIARRGGVIRISSTFPDELRASCKNEAQLWIDDGLEYVAARRSVTFTHTDLAYSLKRHGCSILF